MKLTDYDRPIGDPDVGYKKPPTKKEIIESFGLHKQSYYVFLRRHPECRDWPIESVCLQMQANQDQSYVARRQGQAGRNGWRSKFGKMTYDHP